MIVHERFRWCESMGRIQIVCKSENNLRMCASPESQCVERQAQIRVLGDTGETGFAKLWLESSLSILFPSCPKPTSAFFS